MRSAKKFLQKHPTRASDFQETLMQLSEDAFHPRLKTHKLKGELADSWACSAGYDLRIIFKLTKFQDAVAILLASVGTHDEVY